MHLAQFGEVFVGRRDFSQNRNPSRIGDGVPSILKPVGLALRRECVKVAHQLLDQWFSKGISCARLETFQSCFSAHSQRSAPFQWEGLMLRRAVTLHALPV